MNFLNTLIKLLHQIMTLTDVWWRRMVVLYSQAKFWNVFIGKKKHWINNSSPLNQTNVNQKLHLALKKFLRAHPVSHLSTRRHSPNWCSVLLLLRWFYYLRRPCCDILPGECFDIRATIYVSIAMYRTVGCLAEGDQNFQI